MRLTILRIAAIILLAASCLIAQPPMGRGHDDRTWAERRTQFLSSQEHSQ